MKNKVQKTLLVLLLFVVTVTTVSAQTRRDATPRRGTAASAATPGIGFSIGGGLLGGGSWTDWSGDSTWWNVNDGSSRIAYTEYSYSRSFWGFFGFARLDLGSNRVIADISFPFHSYTYDYKVDLLTTGYPVENDFFDVAFNLSYDYSFRYARLGADLNLVNREFSAARYNDSRSTSSHTYTFGDLRFLALGKYPVLQNNKISLNPFAGLSYLVHLYQKNDGESVDADVLRDNDTLYLNAGAEVRYNFTAHLSLTGNLDWQMYLYSKAVADAEYDKYFAHSPTAKVGLGYRF